MPRTRMLKPYCIEVRDQGVLLKKTGRGVIVALTVKPNAESFRVDVSGGEMVVFCRSPPEGGRANREVVKHLSKIFGKRVLIVEGAKSRNKKIFVEGAALEHIESVLDDLSH